ncbi:MAG: ABC transporter ATP-binding protein [Christensenellaceae bacterium]|nr:ABC transporter ATP-binding protein [Christensenellaceae bacterium]
MKVEVRNLTKQYDRHLAVDSISFSIETGKIYGFLGPNGAGKSTTMNMIAGCLAPTSGQVLIAGYDLHEEPREAKRHIGYLPEMPPLYQDMTPKEFLSFVCEIKHIPKAERADVIADVMQRTGITDVSGRLIRQLSKGYKQRVGIAQALVGYPEFIMLDEPTVGLDPLQIIEIRKLIRELGEKHTVLLSSHILSEVSEICDEVIILSKGRLVARDTTENLGALPGGSRLFMLVEGDEADVRAVLEDAGASGIVIIPAGEGRVEVEAEVEENAKDRIFYAFAEAKLPIREMRTEKMSLEEIFLRYTSSGEGEGHGGDL